MNELETFFFQILHIFPDLIHQVSSFQDIFYRQTLGIYSPYLTLEDFSNLKKLVKPTRNTILFGTFKNRNVVLKEFSIHDFQGFFFF